MSSRLRSVAVAALLFSAVGCGATKSYTATDQLLLSDAVDATIAKLDCTPLSGRKVYLDATYLKTQRSPLMIDADYVLSSLRQQMVGSGVHLVESREESDIIAEARLGALGLDGHSVTYGIPSSSALSTATSVFANAPVVPTIPEMSLARHESKLGAAKVAVFAYDRVTREPFWQSGIARSSSNAKDTWIFGVGPFQRGTIYKKTRFAGNDINAPELLVEEPQDIRETDAYASYESSRVFESQDDAPSDDDTSSVVTANATEPEKSDAKPVEE